MYNYDPYYQYRDEEYQQEMALQKSQTSYASEDWTDPRNFPFTPLPPRGDILEAEINDFLHNLRRFTPHREEQVFVQYLAECIPIDEKIERLQFDLKNDYRFNCRLLFDYFDQRKNNRLDFTELKQALNRLDIHFRDEELFHLFKRFANEDRLISQQEFHDMLVGPFDTIHSMPLGTVSYAQRIQRLDQYLTVRQRDLLAEILELQLQIERRLTHLRQVVGNNIDTLLALFRQIDYRGKGYITLDDLLFYLKQLGGDFIEYQDIVFSFYRISKTHGDRVNFHEFQIEFHVDTQLMWQKELQNYQSSINPQRQDFLAQLQKQKEQLRQQEIEREKRELEELERIKDYQKQQLEKAKTLADSRAQRPGQQQPQLQPQQRGPNLADAIFPGFEKYQFK